MTIELLAVALLLSPSLHGEQCSVADCLRRLGARAQVQLVEASDASLAGHWTMGPALTGAELYLFGDGTYIVTEWGCVQPETIHDKGQWRLASSILEFVPDRDVTWEPGPLGNRRYAVIKIDRARRLFGLDGSLRFLDKRPKREAPRWLPFLSLSFAGGWKQGEGEQTKERLLKDAWRPSAFEGSEAAAER